MPWATRKLKNGNYGIYKKHQDGSLEKIGESSSKEKAEASIRARYASERGK